MAETTNISWCRSTFNSWIGCSKIGPGCDSCYAETLDKRHRWGGATHWGPGVPRHRTSASYWKQPLKWNKQQGEWLKDWREGKGDQPAPWRVFCSSLADVFDNEVPHQWRCDLIDLIEVTPNLSWLLVTKRIGNVEEMLRRTRTHDWLAAQKNVRIMITVVNQEEADRDIPKLLALPCKNGISYEPALGPVNWEPWLTSCGPGIVSPDPFGRDRGLDWIIVGGESSQGKNKARPFDIEWARSTVRQCKAAGVPVFVKQMGSNCGTGEGHHFYPYSFKDRAGADPAEWADDLRVQEFPE